MTEAPTKSTGETVKVALLTRAVVLLIQLFLGALAACAFLILLGFGLIAAWSVYWTYIPAHSARLRVESLNATVTLKFFYVGDVATDAGRYLTIQTPNGGTTIRMEAFDWAHNPRTSLYLTPDQRLAVLGPMHDDHVVSLDPPQAARAFRVASDDWRYLGAFDFVREGPGFGEPVLKFIASDAQRECIPMRSEVKRYDWAPRNTARYRDCPRW